MSLKKNIERRIAALEEKVKSRVISSWVDLMLCEDDEVELSPEFGASLRTLMEEDTGLQARVVDAQARIIIQRLA